MNWEKYRRYDNRIDLVGVFEDEHKGEVLENKSKAIKFIRLVEKYQRIRSRQVAAHILAQADLLLFLS